MPGPSTLNFTEDPDANAFLARDPLALLIGMLLDQQIQMEIAFRSPYVLRDRLGTGDLLDAAAIAVMDPDDLADTFKQKPALHRYPGSMAKRTQQLCAHITEQYKGDTERIWAGAADGADLYRRLRDLPGFGEAKARIFVGVVGKRLGTGPSGWETEAAGWPSIADVAAFGDVAELREQKRAMKEAAKAKKAAARD